MTHCEQQAKKAKVKQAKAAGITQDPNNSDLEELPDTVFTSRKVISKPAQYASLATSRAVTQMFTPVKRTTKVPPATSRYTTQAFEVDQSTVDSASDSYDQEESDKDTSEDDNGTDFGDEENSENHFSGQSPINEADQLTWGNLDVENHAPTKIKATKITDNTGRPKASDYDDVGKEIILKATSFYRCLISTVNGFPESAAELAMVREAWQLATEDVGIQMGLTPDIGKIIKQRGSQLRSEAKTKLTSLVEAMYGFETGQSPKIIAANRELAERLKFEKSFIYKELTEDVCKGMYRHPIIQAGVNKLYFKHKRDEGIVHTNRFNPLPIPAIALILTAIECNIDEWVSGSRNEIIFYADSYQVTYTKHIESLETFGKATMKHAMLETLQKRLHNFGHQHASVEPVALKNEPAIPLSAFEAALKEYEEDNETDEDGEVAFFRSYNTIFRVL
ncbi:hypothetical protein H0H92_008806 [Tricholoma furcatifolium]|nr:hypothetical protein H0H92_008806 [Tricholoma furcatifolium]